MVNQEKLTSRQIQAIEMKKKIYETTVSIYQTTPYEKVTIADICAAAEISTGNFYHYFKNKDDVLLEGFQIIKSHLDEKMEGISLPPLDRFFYGIEVYAEAMEHRGFRFMSIFMHNELLRLIPYKSNVNRSLYTFFSEALIEAFDSNYLVNGTAETVYAHFFRILKGTTYDWCISQGSFSLKEELSAMAELVLAPYYPTC